MTEKNEKKSSAMEKRVIRRVLENMTKAELKDLYLSYLPGKILSIYAPKTFFLDKIIEDISPGTFFGNRDFVASLVDIFDQLTLNLLSILGNHTDVVIKEICKELGIKEIDEIGFKSEIIKRLLLEVPFLRIWKSKRFQRALKPKRVSTNYFKGINTQLSTISSMIEETDSHCIATIQNGFQRIENDIQRISSEINGIKKLFEMNGIK